ncbi:hypothetical protein MPL3356_490065 [Mesorhizobium plurifarium]|uniref:Uncharacterized protein n=1 Tax=Mesorhizobium plurifarium TaxID=69974 RepID=A0A090EBQ1_MESPL|nr:hypothetical protein MPL3356_490065 [Mesorhizobium plurifarium]
MNHELTTRGILNPLKRDTLLATKFSYQKPEIRGDC